MLALTFLTIVSGNSDLASSLLAFILFHVRCITHLIYPIDEEAKEFTPDDKEEILVRQELLAQLKDIKEVLGLRCLSILRYLTDHLSVLVLGVVSRCVTTHDLPGICAAAIQAEPWLRDTHTHREVWRDGLWVREEPG